MSHVERVSIETLTDLDALEAAVARLGGELIRGQKTHAWWGSWQGDWRGERSAFAQGRDPKTFGTCDHAIRIKGKPGVNGTGGPWEIGVTRSGEAWALDYDNYGRAGRELEAVFGGSLDRLVEEYNFEVSSNELIADGYRVFREVDQQGNIHLWAED